MEKLHIYIYGTIENFQSPDAGESWGFVCAKSIVDQIKAYPDAKEIICHIHSPGGDVNEGFAIHDILKTSGKKITTITEGLCASIATIIQLAGSVRQMTKNSEWMVHNPWGMIAGDADALEKYAEQCRTYEDKIANFYADNTGRSFDEMKALMKNETWMNADKAKELGFITEIVEENIVAKKVYAKIDLKNKPKKEIMDKKTSRVETKIDALLKAVGVKFKSKKPAANTVKALDYKDNDGKAVHVETEADAPAKGDVVTLDGQPAPDATINLDNGKILKTDAESKVSSFEDAPADATADAVAKATKKIKAQLVAEQAKVKSLETKVKNRDIRLSNMEKKIIIIAKKIGSTYKPDEGDASDGIRKKITDKTGAEGVKASESYKAKTKERKVAFPTA